MNHTFKASLAKIALATSTLVLAAAAHAVEIGPAPTEASLTATAGPLATASAKVATPNTYGSGTVWYPTAAGQYGLVVVSPGFTESESAINWWGARLASHGFVVVTMGTKTVFDQPESRGKQMMAALKQVAGLNATGPFAGKIDITKQAVAGHSMGGGGTLAAARDNPTLKAAIPLAPWHTTKNFSAVKVPTLIVACEKDIIAPVSSHAQRFYDSMSAATPHAILELVGEDHFCVNTSTEAVNKAVNGKMATAWLKVFMDNDARYKPFLAETKPSAIISRYLKVGL
jgi:triacylglycerol lipase